MNIGGGEAADQLVRMMLSGSEVAVRLSGSAIKNVLALTMALAKKHKTISGKVNLAKMLKETRDVRRFAMSPEQYQQFRQRAGKQKILFSAIRDSDNKGKVVDVIMPVTEIDRANMIFERIRYTGQPEQARQDAPSKEQEAREAVGIQRLKDIRDLQVAFKTEYGHFTPSVDSLKMFYNTGKIKVTMQIGSKDDSVAVANTEALKRRNPRIKPDEMLALYRKGEKLVFQVENDVPVKDTLFHSRSDFNIDSLAFIPFSGDSIIMQSVVRKVSGVQVPLFEACMPYRSLLKGLDNQLRINLDADMRDRGRYEGLQVGSITAPNNNAGNWE